MHIKLSNCGNRKEENSLKLPVVPKVGESIYDLNNRGHKIKEIRYHPWGDKGGNPKPKIRVIVESYTSRYTNP